MIRTLLPPCDHSWSEWVGGPDEWKTVYCDKPANGWGRDHAGKYAGRWGNYCKQHQLLHSSALWFLLNIRELEYRWLTTGYLESDERIANEPCLNEPCPMCGGTGVLTLVSQS
jgi:hypothetical protein